LFLCASVAGVRSAQAGPGAPDDGCLSDPVCRGRYDKAVSLFEGGRYEAALPEFQAAYDRRQMPWLLINIGRTLHRLGRPKEALDHYERYKQAEPRPDAETQERLEKYISQAKALADTPSMQTVQPASTSSPSSATPGSETPLYKKWWFWAAVGGGVLGVVLITGIAVGASRPSGTGLPEGVTTVKVTF
jgi:tetratricopeptide (TPR) repeat protein